MDQEQGQLAENLCESVRSALDNDRPLLHHLNADTSWLLQIPRTGDSGTEKTNNDQRIWYNILIDPWLSGSQSDVAWWFSQQWHSTPCAISSIAALESMLEKIEELSRLHLSNSKGSLKELVTPINDKGETIVSLVDVIAISHEFTDHCHQATLLECHPSTPVLAAGTAAAQLIRGWLHFEAVIETPEFSSAESADWRALPFSSSETQFLPFWLRIARLNSVSDNLYYHSAVMIFFPPTLSNLSEKTELPEEAQMVIYTPHGIYSQDVQFLADLPSKIETLAVLHGLHDVSLSGAQLNLGAYNGLEVQRILRAKYWVGTHDEVKTAGGFVKWFIRRKVLSVKDAIQLNQRAEIAEADASRNTVPYFEVGNGECLVLK